MFFRLKLALRLRDCLSHPHSEEKTNVLIEKTCQDSHTNGVKGAAKRADEDDWGDTARTRKPAASTLEEAKSQLQLLLDDLKAEDSGSLRDTAAQSCYELCIDRSDIRPLFLELDAIDTLLGLARTGKKAAKIFSTLTLTSLTSNEKCRKHLMEKGILRLLLKQVDGRESPEEVKRGCLRAIGRLAKFCDASEEILKLRGLDIIVDVLHSDKECLQRRALIALYFIAADKPEIQDAFIDVEAIKPLLKLSQSSNPGVQLEALDVCKVLSRSKACAVQFVQESAIGIFVDAASHGLNKEIKSSAHRIMQRLCNHGPEISQRIVQEGTVIAGCDLSEDGVDKLIDVFSHGVISLQEEAAKIVEELCQTDPIASR